MPRYAANSASRSSTASTVAEHAGAGAEAALIDAMAAAVARHRTRRVPLPVLLAAAASVDRTAASRPGWRARVLAAIEGLAAANVAAPSTKRDVSGDPALPQFVLRPVPDVARISPERVLWHADLAWAARAADDRALTHRELVLLTAVNRWLPRRRGLVVPIRERSLEVLNDEKVLEGLLGGRLFAPGRLSVGLLECRTCWPPVDQVVLGDGPWLIVENYTTYRSVADWAADRGFDGRVVWGSGNQVGTRLAALALAGVPCSGLFYFGDVDLGGFKVAKMALRRAGELGLGVLVPARGFYQLALNAGLRRPTGHSGSAELAAWAGTWLGGPLGVAAAEVVAAGQHIVQEHVGTEVLARLEGPVVGHIG